MAKLAKAIAEVSADAGTIPDCDFKDLVEFTLQQ